MSDAEEFLEKVYSQEQMLGNYWNSKLVSMLHIIPFGTKAYIYAVATQPEFRGKGLASELIKAAIKHCKEQGFEEVLLIPDSEQLKTWYEGFGFEGSYPVVFDGYGYDFGTGEHSRDLAMRLNLNKGQAESQTTIVLKK